MKDDLLQRFIDEVMEDYEQHGKGRDVEEWFLEAIKRHIIDVTEEEALSIRTKLIEGIRAYRETKARLSKGGTTEAMPEEVMEEIAIIAGAAVGDLEQTVKAMKE